jgi:hypothetical protein
MIKIILIQILFIFIISSPMDSIRHYLGVHKTELDCSNEERRVIIENLDMIVKNIGKCVPWYKNFGIQEFFNMCLIEGNFVSSDCMIGIYEVIDLSKNVGEMKERLKSKHFIEMIKGTSK